MVKLKPNAQRAQLAMIFVWLSLGAMLITLIVVFYQLTLMNEVKSDGASMDLLYRVQTSDTLVTAINSIFALVYIGSWIAFISWYRRAYFNLHSLTKGLQLSEGWASGAWFVPIYNLWAPFNIGQDLFKHSERLLINGGLTKHKESRLQTLGLWWAFWIGAIVISAFKSGLKPEADELFTIDEFINYCYAAIGSGVVFIVAGIFAIKMIKQYREMENLLPQLSDVSGAYSDDSDLLDSEF